MATERVENYSALTEEELELILALEEKARAGREKT